MDRDTKSPPAAKAAKRPYEAPKIVHEEYIEAVAVACDPNATPFLPVKNSDGQVNQQGGTCQTGFLNS